MPRGRAWGCGDSRLSDRCIGQAELRTQAVQCSGWGRGAGLPGKAAFTKY